MRRIGARAGEPMGNGSSLSVKREFKLAYKVYAGESVVSPRKETVQKTRKLAVVAARLGRWERLTLACVQEMKVEYQFRIADVVKCIEEHGIPNTNHRLNKRIHDAVRRLRRRGIVVKGDKRGVYALRRDLARLSVLGFPLVRGVGIFANTNVGKYVEKTVGRVVENSVFSPSEGKENLGGGVGVFGTGLTKVQCGGDGGFGVVRVHVVSPGGWVGYYVAVSFVSRVLSFVSSYVRGVLVSLYGVSFVRDIDSLVNRVFDYVVSSARVVGGCHGRYNDSPGDFSPLGPDCEVHNYEYGVDLHVPGYVAQVVDRLINYVKVYVKTPGEIREGNPGYYEDLLRVLGPPPPPPPGLNDLLARLGSLFDSRGSIGGL
jgi:hypothetical protein